MGVNDVEWGDFFSPSSVGSPASSGSSDGGNGGGHPGGWASEPSETFSTPPPPEPAPITPWYETFDPSDAQVQADIEASTVSQPETIFYDTTGGDSGFTSDDTTNPYYTTDGTFIPEQKPLVATPDQHPSDFMVGNVIADALANQSVNPGYALSWAYNPDNPNNLGTYDPQGNFQTGISPTLGSIFVTDSSGNPILDSSGNPIKTNYGTDIINYVQESLQDQGPVDLSLYGAEGPTGFFENILSPEELSDFQDTWWHGYTAPGGGGGYEDYGWGYDDYYGDRRDAKMQFLAALEAGPYGKNLEQSGFFNELVPQYHPDEAREALESGIFSGMYGKPGQVGISGEGMKRMIRSYGSGLTSPHYKNIATYAKGGIVGLLGV
jgi:hypothetical protein